MTWGYPNTPHFYENQLNLLTILSRCETVKEKGSGIPVALWHTAEYFNSRACMRQPFNLQKQGPSMFKSKTTDILSHVSVFDGLIKADLKTISKYCHRIGFKRGETLIEIGQTSSAFYVLIKGQLKVVLPERLEGSKEHRVSEVKLNTLNEGDCFGEYSLLEKAPASASVIGVQAGEVLKIPESGFHQIIANDRIGKTVYCNLLHVLINRLRKKEEELDLVLVVG